MSEKTAFQVRISPALRRAASRLAKEEGISLDYWINMAIAQKLGSAETAAYFRRGLGRPHAGDLRAILDRVPDNPPIRGDEIPAGLRSK